MSNLLRSTRYGFTCLLLGAFAATGARADDTPNAGKKPEPIVHKLQADTLYVNVAGKKLPEMPKFEELAAKPGFVRGYVKDVHGKPLKNAKLGIRATAIGGAYSGAQGTTDANGYYEFAVPMGACHFYNAGYAIDYADGRAALGLHPADGELDSFASNVGGVENFVLLGQGVADRDDAQDQPAYSGNYYGGAFYVDFRVAEGRIFDGPTDLPQNSTIELTLTPTSKLIDGAEASPITITKPVGAPFTVLNVPIATYELSAKLADGTKLKLREVGPRGDAEFGLDPKKQDTAGPAKLTFRPGTAKADMVTPAHGSWEGVQVMLEK